MNNKRKIGSISEKAVGRYLEKEGYEILQYNFRSRFSEVDIVAKEDRYLVFVEVKWRSSDRNGAPEEAVDKKKQQRIIRGALYYLVRYRVPEGTPIRFDIAAVEHGNVRLIRDAFIC